MNKLEALKKILEEANQNKLFNKKITVYGYQFNYEATVVSSISKYWFGDKNIIEMIAPFENEEGIINRPGVLKASYEYVTIHDTASSKNTADEFAHAKYVSNGGGGTSWHYSVGDKASCHQIPDDEIAYHAGDSTQVRFELFNTGVKGVNEEPLVEIIDGYYSFDGKKSKMLAPTDDGRVLSTLDINDASIRVSLINNEYYIGPTYYNKTYHLIANRGGNLNSIGIETMVNEGSNLMRTWHRCAKLTAFLLVQNNLTPSRVKPHHFFSGKPCPMTLRKGGLWDYFLDCVKVEYEVLKNFSDVSIELIEKPGFIMDDGLIDEMPKEMIEYKVRLKDNKEELIFTLKCEN